MELPIELAQVALHVLAVQVVHVFKAQLPLPLMQKQQLFLVLSITTKFFRLVYLEEYLELIKQMQHTV